MKETLITRFRSVRDKKPQLITLQTAFNLIKEPSETTNFIELLRVLPIEQYKERKKGLPVFYFTGQFNDQTNKGITESSGLAIVDFDGFPDNETLNKDRERIQTDPHVVACFLSPSGRGFKAVVRIDPTTDNKAYNICFKALKERFNSLYWDNNNQGIARACFASYDPNLFVNFNATVFRPEMIVTPTSSKPKANPIVLTEMVATKKKTSPPPHALTTQQTFDLLIDRECSGLNWSEGNWNAALYFLAARCNDYSISLNDAKNLCWRYADRDGTGKDEAMQTIESAYNQPSENKDYTPKKREFKPRKQEAQQVFGDMLFSVKDANILELIEKTGVRKNLLTDSIELMDGTSLTDERVNFIAMQARAMSRCEISSTRIMDVITSPYTLSFHPFNEYLESIAGLQVVKGTVQQVLNCMVLDDHHPDYKEKVIKKWLGGLMGALTGSYSVMTLILIGGQGIGKTVFFRNLLPLPLQSYFVECQLTDDKDVYARMCSNLIAYDDEFTGKNKTEASIYKKLSSAEKFTYRKPYGRIDITRKRTAVLCGSANEYDVINDTTGNRRIIPARLKKIDHEKFSKINLNDFYRELLELHKENPTWWHLKADEIALLNYDTEANTAPDEHKERVLKYTTPDPTGHVTTTEVEHHIHTWDTSYKTNTNKLGRALTQVYGCNTIKKINGVNVRGYSLRLLGNT